MYITTNILAMNANMNLKINTGKEAKTSERLSSGFRINRAADDAAGLTISEKMRRQIRGLDKGSNNIQDGISLIQVADGALQEVHNILHRMKELTIQASNDTNTAADRLAIQSELEELSDAVDDIGKNTTFNGYHIFDDTFHQEESGKITSIVQSEAAKSGYLTEAYKTGSSYHPAAFLDFSGVNASNISNLDGAGFSFNCSENCREVFDIKFATDGSPSSATNLSGKVHHYYTVDISNCSNGADIVSTTYDYISNNLPTTATDQTTSDLQVSHSNYLAKVDNSKLVVYAATTSPTEASAKNVFPNSTSGSGAIDCTSLVRIPDSVFNNEFTIQCSSNMDDKQIICTRRMNANILQTDLVDVTSFNRAQKSIGIIDKAVKTISDQRTSLGAFQNRLEHSFANNNNAAENIQASESRIRDANMATEIADHSKNTILMQSAQSMITQANQLPQGVLNLLK